MIRNFFIFPFICILLASCSTRSKYERAKEFHDNGENGSAIRYLEKHIKPHKRDNYYFFYHGFYESQTRIPNFREAISDFSKINEDFQRQDIVVRCLIDWNFEIHNYEKSMELIEANIDKNMFPDTLPLKLVYGRCLFNLGRYPEFVELYPNLCDSEESYWMDEINYLVALFVIDGKNDLLKFECDKNNAEETFYYALSLFECGFMTEAYKLFESTVGDTAHAKKSAQCMELIQIIRSNPVSFDVPDDSVFYIDSEEEALTGKMIASLFNPDITEMRLSAIYFFLAKDYRRSLSYASHYKFFLMQRPPTPKMKSIDEFLEFFKEDLLFQYVNQARDKVS